MNKIIEFKYTLEDFATPAPYEYIESISDPFQKDTELERLVQYAKSIKYTRVRSSLKAYQKSQEKAKQSLSATPTNIIEFDNNTEYETANWQTDGSGIYRIMGNGNIQYACTHEIMPIERLVNIDTREIKYTLAYRRSKHSGWKSIVVNSDTISNARNIVSLSAVGISVSSGDRSQNLVDYLRDVVDYNYDTIPERKSIARMGWNEEGFSPYVKDVVFDGNDGFANIFNAIKEHGSFEDWKAEAIKNRKYSLAARIVLTASFASALIEPVGANPFFIHLWGSDSGTGKTVAQMLAVSVWGVPTVPGSPLLPSFKGTTVGYEVRAGFLNSIPLVLDELQLAKDNRGKVIFNVYELASGQGKTRSNKTLGLAETPTWRNVFITSGETPLVSETDGAGAHGRVLEIECKTKNRVVENGNHTASVLNNNYGFAGKIFVEKLMQDGNLERAKELYNKYFKECSEDKVAEKQAMAAAILLIADKFATEWIFQDGEPLKVSDLSEFLKSNESVSVVERGYSYICDWVFQNGNRFRTTDNNGDFYGEIDGDYAYIIPSVFKKACSDNGINSKTLLSGLKTTGKLLVRADGRGYQISRRFTNILKPINCIALKLPDENEVESDDLEEEYPF